MKNVLNRCLALLLLTGSMWAGGLTAAPAEMRVNPRSEVALTIAVRDAQALAAQRKDCRVMRVEGDSMLPFFGSGAVLVIRSVSVEKLKPGMVVVYRNRFNETVAHRVVAQSGAGNIVQGYNNDRADSTAVDAANLLGVVYATFYSESPVADANVMLAAAGVEKPAVVLAASAR